MRNDCYLFGMDCMSDEFVNSDQPMLELLRERGALSVSELAELVGVTATAIRQRLTRLMHQDLVQRMGEVQGRGRPQHRYSLTSAGLRKAGENFTDLATVVWEEIVSIDDPELRRRMVRGIAKRMAAQYDAEMHGKTTEEKMKALAKLFGERQIPISVETQGQLPILNMQACPYPDLADKDHLICEMESVMFETLVGEELAMQHCTSGGGCCRFEPKQNHVSQDQADLARADADESSHPESDSEQRSGAEANAEAVDSSARR